MDLLLQIFCRMPGNTVRRLSDDLPDDVRKRLLDSWIGTRLEKYRGKLGVSTEAEYFILASYAGDPVTGMTDRLTKRMISARQAFLRSTDFVAGCDIDIALMSGVPQIQIQALEDARDKFAIPDLEIIPWTPDVIAYYDDLLERMPGGKIRGLAARLAGYLRINILHKISHRVDKQLRQKLFISGNAGSFRSLRSDTRARSTLEK